MTTALVPTNGILDGDQLELLKRTLCVDATNDEFAMFAGICKRKGLDPFSKQIYFRKYNTQQGPRVTVITGIDGYRAIASRTGEYEGQTDPEWCGEDGVWTQVWLSSKPPVAARVGVWRRGFRQAATAIARWSEYYPSNPKERFMWDKMPANQLAKCSEALALRKAFPDELGGLHVKEEMDQAGNEVTAYTHHANDGSRQERDSIRAAVGQDDPRTSAGSAPPSGVASSPGETRAGRGAEEPALSSPKGEPRGLEGLRPLPEDRPRTRAGEASEGARTTGREGDIPRSGGDSAPPPSGAKPRAPSIKHSGDYASADQVKYLHVLARKAGVECPGPERCGIAAKKYSKRAGGLVDATIRCDYHKALFACKDQDGNGILTSTNLCPSQISHLISRLEAKVAKDEAATQEIRSSGAPDISVLTEEKDELLEKLFYAAKDTGDEDGAMNRLCDFFKVVQPGDLTKERCAEALQRLLNGEFSSP